MPSESTAAYGVAGESEKPAAGRRKHHRQPVNWPAVCRSDSFGDWNVTIVEASDEGFGLDRALPIPLESRFRIELSGIGTFLCRIAWSSGGRCGVELIDGRMSIPPGEIDSLGRLLIEADI